MCKTIIFVVSICAPRLFQFVQPLAARQLGLLAEEHGRTVEIQEQPEDVPTIVQAEEEPRVHKRRLAPVHPVGMGVRIFEVSALLFFNRFRKKKIASQNDPVGLRFVINKFLILFSRVFTFITFRRNTNHK